MTLDRTGEPLDPDDTAPVHNPRCHSGWLDDSYDSDRPVPCPDCHPKAADSIRRHRDTGPSNVDSDSRPPVAPWSDEHGSPRTTGYPRTAESE